MTAALGKKSWSPSSRRAWIEIMNTASMRTASLVALLAEGVDRNVMDLQIVNGRLVALLAEGVDRNASVALLGKNAGASPSSRRAWIEISCSRMYSPPSAVALLAEGVDRNTVSSVQENLLSSVALLAEGVDRNTLLAMGFTGKAASPSSRRAWIEISCFAMAHLRTAGRPPRGGRG